MYNKINSIIGVDNMKILVLTGSPRKKGTTARLASAFIEGAEEAGHTVERLDTAFMNISPCKACYYCRKNGGKCVKEDDMIPLLGENGKLLSADVIVLVTPLYYFGMSAQLKTVLDRFYAAGREFRNREQKAILITAAGDEKNEVAEGLKLQFHLLCQWTHWEESGLLAALGCHEPKDLGKTSYLRDARLLGRSL